MSSRLTNIEISQILRRRIVEGDWRPGRRLPTRLELEKELGASTATIQKAIHQLIRDGFLETRRRAGTFVSHRLPHLYRIGLLLPLRPSADHPGSRFWRTLRDVAEHLEPASGIEMTTYYDVEVDPPSDSFRQLIDDIEHNRIGGVFGLSIAWEHARHTPLMEHPDLARVALRSRPIEGVPRVMLKDYVDQVLAVLKEEGRQRVAAIHHASMPQPTGSESPHQSRWRTAAAEYGITAAQNQIIPIHPGTPQTAEAVVRLMMDLPPARRPDALVIVDDHLVEAATAGLHATGIRVPDDVLVFGHCNFPDRPPSSVPVRWIGYDVEQVLNVGIDLLRRQLGGEAMPEAEAVPAHFETEYREAKLEAARNGG